MFLQVLFLFILEGRYVTLFDPRQLVLIYTDCL